jgi:hypothetical protein
MKHGITLDEYLNDTPQELRDSVRKFYELGESMPNEPSVLNAYLAVVKQTMQAIRDYSVKYGTAPDSIAMRGKVPAAVDTDQLQRFVSRFVKEYAKAYKHIMNLAKESGDPGKTTFDSVQRVLGAYLAGAGMDLEGLYARNRIPGLRFAAKSN